MTVRSVVLAALAAMVALGAAQDGHKAGVDPSTFDRSVRPQDDLFRYVNGVWLAKTALPPDRATYGTFIELRDQAEANLYEIVKGLAAEPNKKAGSTAQQVGDFFASFMDEPALESLGATPLRAHLAEIGQVKSTSALAALLGRLSLIGVGGPVGDGVQPDKMDPTKETLYVGQSDLLLPDRDYYLGDTPNFLDTRVKYEAYLDKIFTLAGRPNAAADAKAVLALETSLAKIQWTKVEDRDAVKTYNPTTLAKLVTDAPGFDWTAWGRAQHVDTAPQWVVEEPSYFKSFAALVPGTPLETWKAWVTAEVITGDAPYLSKAFVDTWFGFFGQALTGQQVQRDRWKRGVQLASGSLGEALGQLYVAKYFPVESKNRMQTLVANLLEAYRRSITGLDWMSPDTKKAALAKLDKIGRKIGYPNTWRSYAGLEIRPHDLVGNVERANRFEADYQLAKLGHPINRDEWDMTPQTVNAYYTELHNEIVFPAAILQAPFFDPLADDAANYGAIGAIIGHEIGHAFDDQGSKYDGDGKLHDWWAPADAVEFQKRTKLLVDQFNAYSPLPGVHVNGALTLGEDIGDLGGLSIAYQAWKIALGGRPSPVIDGLTGDQRFFCSWAQAWRAKATDAYLQRQVLADPHAWAEFRANGPVSNIQGFYDAFNVKPGDKLYREPSLRVHIW